MDNTCCFFGHRKICKTEKLKTQIYEVIEKLIVQKNISVFLFGSKSEFDTLCYELVTEIKNKYPHIKRIYVRAEYPTINDEYKAYLLNCYEETYYPENIIGAAKSVYIKRNYEMIDKSQFCIVYYESKNIPIERKSGTKTAVEYALKHKKTVYKFP